ncbi:MAG: transposase, partial [Chlamydiae bacterium]|nr:transposase [Chlamydiota bacterium]
TLGQREYLCECGLRIDRDLNAAINIKNKAVGASVKSLLSCLGC